MRECGEGLLQVYGGLCCHSYVLLVRMTADGCLDCHGLLCCCGVLHRFLSAFLLLRIECQEVVSQCLRVGDMQGVELVRR